MLEFINWELVSLVVVVLSAMAFLIRAQMNINKQIFIKITEMRKDISYNRDVISKHQEEAEQLRKENREDHQNIITKMDEIISDIKNI